MDCCYPVKCISGHYGELIFGQKKKINVLLSPDDSLAAFAALRACCGYRDLHARDGRAGEHQGRVSEGARHLRGKRMWCMRLRLSAWATGMWSPSNSTLR